MRGTSTSITSQPEHRPTNSPAKKASDKFSSIENHYKKQFCVTAKWRFYKHFIRNNFGFSRNIIRLMLTLKVKNNFVYENCHMMYNL